MKTFCAYLALLLPAFAQQAPLNFAGTITGKLTGDDGSNIAGGLVTLQLQPPYTKSRFFQAEWDVQTGSDGSFRFGRLNEGTYRVCAHVPQSAWLNPCQWGLHALTVTLSSASPTGAAALTLAKGAVVPIRVDDPGQLLTQYEGKVPGAQLLVGVGTDNLAFSSAPIVSQDSGGRNQQIVIPFGSTVKLVVSGSQFQLSSAGVPLPAGTSMIPITVASGQAPPSIELQVTGRSAP